ncbi:Cyclic di-GMP phosphodiesterase response regulator RpfG [Natranaerofaba carboxydovora]|nr:Cyclic di-GMP phosphodiesterase response regulator RpfG [Natranaerofaba carboxydovora]
MLGHNVNEIIGKSFDEFLHPEDYEKMRCFQSKILEQGLLEESVEHRIKHKNGTWRWHNSRFNLLEEAKDDICILGIARDVTEQKEVDERIRHISFHDSLTGLYNRYYIEEEIKRLDTNEQLPISLIMADVNGLKLLNDTYGHKAGDELIKKVGNLLKEFTRDKDIVARWGGDEFVVLLPQTSKEKAEKIAQRLVQECRKKYVEAVPVRFAVGTYTKDSKHISIEKAFNEAENRMYKNKLDERNATRNEMVSAMLNTLKNKSSETEAHLSRMVFLSYRFGNALNLSEEDMEKLFLIATLHDIGKIILPEKVLKNEGRLTSEEHELYKEHPKKGEYIARASENFVHLAEDIGSHHERWDGKGYPNGLVGENIPFFARVIAIVDYYENKTNDFLGEKAMSKEEALKEIKENAGIFFDPELAKVFVSFIKKGNI